MFTVIPNTNGKYEINESGTVRVIKTGRVLKTTSIQGYIYVAIQFGKKYRQRAIHRLLLLTFKARADSADLHVNHINGIREDNRLNNLEWATASENARVPRRTKRAKGVYSFPHTPNKPYRVVVKFNGKAKTVGYYANELDAREAYEDAFTAHYGFSPNATRISVSQLPKVKKAA